MRRMIGLVGLLAVAMLSVGWGERKQYGTPIDAQAPVVTLKQIGADPAAYKDKHVVLQGNYGFYCCPTDFSYKEGLEVVQVTPNGFEAPKLKTGTPVSLSGVVKVGHLPEEEEAERGEKAEEAHEAAEFYLEATGLALR